MKYMQAILLLSSFCVAYGHWGSEKELSGFSTKSTTHYQESSSYNQGILQKLISLFSSNQEEPKSCVHSHHVQNVAATITLLSHKSEK